MTQNIDDLLALAEKAIADLQGEFEAGTERRIRQITDTFLRRWRPLATREAAVTELRRLNHDMRGEAGTFGYGLLGQIAEQFSDYLRETPVPEQKEEAVRDYVDALRFTWAQRIRGDGGPRGARLLDNLRRMNPGATAGRAA